MNSNAQSWQKYLKYLSIFFIIFNLAMVVVGVLIATGTISYDTMMAVFDVPDGTFGEYDQSLVAGTLGVCFSIAYVISLVITLFAYRGAKDPSKMTPGMVLLGIDSAFTLVSIVCAIVNGSFSWFMMSNAIIIWTMFYGSLQVNSLAKK